MHLINSIWVADTCGKHKSQMTEMGNNELYRYLNQIMDHRLLVTQVVVFHHKRYLIDK